MFMQSVRYVLMVLVYSYGVVAYSQALPVDNFYQVSTELYRSGQPTKEGMLALEGFGIKTVINLRQFNSDDDEAKGTNLELKRIPMNAGYITDEKVITALRAIKEAPKPAVVHCWHGSDRTGVVVALYRLVFEGASKDQVIAELRDDKYGYHERWYPNIVTYIKNVDVAAIRKSVLANS